MSFTLSQQNSHTTTHFVFHSFVKTEGASGSKRTRLVKRSPGSTDNYCSCVGPPVLWKGEGIQALQYYLRIPEPSHAEIIVASSPWILTIEKQTKVSPQNSPGEIMRLEISSMQRNAYGRMPRYHVICMTCT